MILYLKGNQLLLRYDKHWEALIEHYDEKKCLLREGENFCKGMINFATQSPHITEAVELYGDLPMEGNKVSKSMNFAAQSPHFNEAVELFGDLPMEGNKVSIFAAQSPHFNEAVELYGDLPMERNKVSKSMNFVAQPPHFIEAEKLAQIPFLYHHLLECDYNGLEYTIEDHDITLKIPTGALAMGEKVHIEIGVALYGPFTFPEKTRPISPIVWLCIQEDVELKKPFQLILPHFLIGLSKETLHHHQIRFSKASHKYLLENSQMIYKFENCDTKPLLASCENKSYGMMKSTHCCFYCIQANQTLEVARDAGYCLARIENSPLPHQLRNEVYFTAVYFLRSCLKVHRGAINFM